MPIVRIDFDNERVDSREIKNLSIGVQKIVSEETGIGDVMVYADSSEIKIKVHPVEIFVQMSAHKVPDIDALVGKIRGRIAAWKQESGFAHPINLTFIPMEWRIEIGI